MASPEFNFSLLTAPLEQRDQRKLEQRVMAYTAPQLEYCNVASAASGEQIVGTAPLLQIAVAIELPAKDWDVFRDAALRNERRLELSARAAQAGLRFALLIFETSSTPRNAPFVTVRVLRRKASLSAGYAQTQHRVLLTELDDFLEAALFERSALTRFAAVEPDGKRLLLVCVHGRVDAACAKFGVPLQRHLERMQVSGVTVCRCAHFGGHRFAPTAVELPSLRLWGRLTTQTATALATRSGDLPALLRSAYRGSSSVDSYTQLLERAAWDAIGWDWLLYRATGRVTALDGEPDLARLIHPSTQTAPPAWAEVRLDFIRPDGRSGAFTGRVERVESVHTLGSTGGRKLEYAQFALTEFSAAPRTDS